MCVLTVFMLSTFPSGVMADIIDWKDKDQVEPSNPVGDEGGWHEITARPYNENLQDITTVSDSAIVSTATEPVTLESQKISLWEQLRELIMYFICE